MQTKHINVACVSALAIIVGGCVSGLRGGVAGLQSPAIEMPARGEIVVQLRPTIALSPVAGADTYLIEISPEPTFNGRNTISYVSRHVDGAPTDGMQGLRFAGLYQKYTRYGDRHAEPWRWKVPYNLTAMVSAPNGYRILPCRGWLKAFADRITEGRDDPLQAINEFVSFGIVNEGSGPDYYNAYEISPGIWESAATPPNWSRH